MGYCLAQDAGMAGMSAELMGRDLRTVARVDIDTVVTSVSRTSRLLVANEAVLTGGIGAEIAAVVAERCFYDLDAPVARIAPPPTPVPYAPGLERAWPPDAAAIADGIHQLCNA
jgi:2-oxoisovalerate dehydrogenase E1 component